MKKFLTVLLALSVVFTYTVGTAFAASQVSTVSASDYATDNTSKVAATTAVKYANTYSASAITQANAQAAKLVDQKLVADLITVIEDKAGSLDTDSGMDAFKAEIDKWLGLDKSAATPDYIGKSVSTTGGTVDLQYALGTYDALFVSLVEAKDFDGRIADAKSMLENYDTSIYSNRAYNVDYTHRTYADKLIREALTELAAVKADSVIKNSAGATMKIGSGSGDNSTYKDVITGILYGYTFDQAEAASTYVTLGTKANPVKVGTANSKIGVIGNLNELLKVSDESSDDQNDKIALEQAKLTLEQYAKKTFFEVVDQTAGAAVNEEYAAVKNNKLCGVYIADTKKLTKAEAAAINTAIMEDINKALAVINVYLEEKSTTPGADVTGFTTSTATMKTAIQKALTAADKYDNTVDLADKMKKELMFDGTKKYNDADIDTALAKDKIEIYANFQNPSDAKSYLSAVKVVTDEVGSAIDAAKAKFMDKVVLSGPNKTEDADKKYCKNYYDASFGYKYDLIKAETIAKLEDAKTVEEVGTIMAEADTKLAELRANEANTSAFTSGVTRYKAALEEYAKEQCKLLNKNDLVNTKDYRPASFLDKTDKNVTSALEDGFDIIENAKSADGLAAAYEEAKALFKNIKTDADLKAEALKVSNLLAALPTAAAKDLSNETQFVEAVKAYNEYLDMYGAEKSDIKGYAVFEVKAAALKGYQEAALAEDINNFSKLAPIDLADKEAVKAVRDKLEGYLTLYGIDSALYDGTTDGNANHDKFTLGAATYKKLTDAENKIWAAEVEEVENLIKKLNDNSTVAELKAAKAAYDALTGSQQRSVRETLGEAFLYKLEVIEKNQIKAVEALKITASSTAGKGYIKVKWTVKGDAAAADGYQVYRSTKRNSGFGTKPYFTTKAGATTYKNTKSLKKGTRYYYKVRAFKVVDGKNVYSDWSNKAYRIAK